MDTRIETLDEEEAKEAYQQGLALAEMMGLFAFFINKTPEGKKVKKELEADWLRVCERLRAEKKIIGAEFSCSCWLKEVKKALLAEKKPKVAGNRVNNSNMKVKMEKNKAKKPLMFKNI